MNWIPVRCPHVLDSGAVPPRFGTCPPAERVTTKVFVTDRLVQTAGHWFDKPDWFGRLPVKIDQI